MGSEADQDKKEILSSFERYRLAVIANDPRRALDHWGDDMVWMRPDTVSIEGIDACREAYIAAIGKMRVLEYEVATAELVILGDWAIHRIEVKNLVKLADVDPPVAWDSKSIIIWRRQDDRQWKFARAINNSNIPGGRVGYPRPEETEA